MKTTLPAILLYVAAMHFLAVACLSTHATPIKTVFLCGCVLVGAWLVSMFNDWGEK